MNESPTPGFLAGKQILILLALLTSFPPLSTDMYLPALPLLQAHWQQPAPVVNLTLSAFFATFGASLLVYGPLSDRFGRRRPLLVGISLFVVASLLCATAWSVASLVAFRVLQAAGAASAAAIALAVTKDVYDGAERERIMALIAVIMALAPMLAPTIGGWILAIASWRWVFVVLAGVGVVSLVGVVRMPETAGTPTVTNAAQVFGAYGQVLFHNRRFAALTVMLSVVAVVHFCFIGGSAVIYIQEFGLSEQTFGYFFAFNAAMIMAGSLLCRFLSGRVGTYWLVLVGLGGVVLGSVGLLTDVLPGPWRLAVPMALASFAFGLMRPPSNNLMLEQVDRHAGAASSVMVFTFFLVAAVAMWVIALPWQDRITTIGRLGTGTVGVVFLIWLLLPRRFFFPDKATAPASSS